MDPPELCMLPSPLSLVCRGRLSTAPVTHARIVHIPELDGVHLSRTFSVNGNQGNGFQDICLLLYAFLQLSAYIHDLFYYFILSIFILILLHITKINSEWMKALKVGRLGGLVG